MSVNLIRRATLVGNLATFEVPEGEPLQVGAILTTAGCTTTALNASVTVVAAGLCAVSNGGINENWSGFTAAITNSNVAIETESGATVTTSFGTSTSKQTTLYDQ